MLYFILLNLFHDNNQFEFCIVIINYRSINKRVFIRNCNRKYFPVTLYNSISSHHIFETKCSWLIYYLGKKFEDKFLSVTIELCYLILHQKLDEISAAAMWQASNVTTNAQRIIVRHLSDFVGNRLIVPESCISTLGQIMFTQNLIQSF